MLTMHELGEYQLIGSARTDARYPLVIITRWNIPFLLYAPGHGQVAMLLLCIFSYKFCHYTGYP